MGEIAAALVNLEHVGAWLAIALLVGASWATLWVRLGQLRTEQRHTSRRVGALSRRVRKVEIRLGPSPDD